ncbi:MAG: DUF354 domain-containing protein [Bacteroidia bacterium]|nr:DUF354 domain-containing protein [Bacteroidia bacterium]
MPKRFLFFFVHPSKFHVFKNTINALKRNGHHVDIVITSKDVLEELVKSEGWDYVNIFPNGRKIKNVSPYISAAINFFRTIHRLFKFVGKKNYDLFITDDLLVYVGKIKKTPSIVFCDDDIQVVKQFSLVLAFADHCLAPFITDLGKYNSKKIGFDGYKELAYLHPNQFKLNDEIVKKFKESSQTYFILRLVSLTAYHDVGKTGITVQKALTLIELLKKYGKVYISAERPLEKELEPYRIQILPKDLKDVLAGAFLYIGDSQTMSSEAAIMGVPSFRINDFTGKISVMEEKDHKYKLSKSFKTSEFNELYKQVESCLNNDEFKLKMNEKKKNMLKEKIDLTAFMTWLFENFPGSLTVLKDNSNYQKQFIS